jgi:hypothetical protein
MEKNTISIPDQEALKDAAIASVVNAPSLMDWKKRAHPHRTLPIDAFLGNFTL